MSLITLVDAGFKYPGTSKWVFRHLNMVIELGETVRLLGRNGSGKTTLLKVMSGLVNLKEGELRNQPGLKAVYMDQFAGDMLARDLTIQEQLKAAASNESLLAVSMKMLDEFGIDLKDRLEEFVGHLSGGQRQIVALLCTLASGANVFCLDEFTSSLDEKSMEVANRLLDHAKRTGNLTLVIVSHAIVAVQSNREFSLIPNPL